MLVSSRKLNFETDIAVTPEIITNAFIDKSMLFAWWDVEGSLIEPRKNGARRDIVRDLIGIGIAKP